MINHKYTCLLPKELKEQAENFFGQFDIGTSDAIRIFERSVVIYGKMPFETKLTNRDVPIGSDSSYISCRTDIKLHDKCKKILKKEGYVFSVAVRIYLAECVNQKRIPFIVRGE